MVVIDDTFGVRLTDVAGPDAGVLVEGLSARLGQGVLLALLHLGPHLEQ